MTQFSTHAEFPVEVVVQHVLEAQKQALEDEEVRMAGQSRDFRLVGFPISRPGLYAPKHRFNASVKKLKTVTPKELMHSFYKEDGEDCALNQPQADPEIDITEQSQ